MGQIGRMGFSGTSGGGGNGGNGQGGGKPRKSARNYDRAKRNERFYGKPGELKENWDEGYLQQTLIGMDGKAVVERHHTDHHRSEIHTNPHDHIITWVKRESDGKEHLLWGSHIDYREGQRVPKLEEFLK